MNSNYLLLFYRGALMTMKNVKFGREMVTAPQILFSCFLTAENHAGPVVSNHVNQQRIKSCTKSPKRYQLTLITYHAFQLKMKKNRLLMGNNTLMYCQETSVRFFYNI